MRKTIAALAIAVMFLLSAGPAQAWEIIARDRGYGYAEVNAWTRNFHQVAFIAVYTGHADILTMIRCPNGFRDRHWWTDSGPRFRYVVYGVPGGMRCVQRFVVDLSSNNYVGAAVAAQ
jgi:hypothetical protein